MEQRFCAHSLWGELCPSLLLHPLPIYVCPCAVTTAGSYLCVCALLSVGVTRSEGGGDSLRSDEEEVPRLQRHATPRQPPDVSRVTWLILLMLPGEGMFWVDDMSEIIPIKVMTRGRPTMIFQRRYLLLEDQKKTIPINLTIFLFIYL